ncbi:hypothetical protein OPT61_g7402 [Boeremia exigua]|uniref:Uncharacterized protein n=1 Tax=Boeremia exigua TaxID=749465 RepID=A0ACC2I2E3_9PLEO|nr:hypothetical protein OPT61_g7402 [Boeremia exigua]
MFDYYQYTYMASYDIMDENSPVYSRYLEYLIGEDLYADLKGKTQVKSRKSSFEASEALSEGSGVASSDMGTTLRQCFEQEAPRCPLSMPGKSTPKATASSTGTLKQKPPKVLMRVKSTFWTGKADSYLGSNSAKQSKELNTMVVADPEIVASPLKLESDYKTDITIGTEVRSDNFRHDLSFKVERGTTKEKTVAIIEFKRLGYIDYNEFDKASYDDESAAKARFNDLKQNHETTTLTIQNSSLVLIKQATAYAMKWRCRSVALCDYDNLVLLKYADSFGLDFVEVTTVPRCEIRKALLGFFISACDSMQLT